MRVRKTKRGFKDWNLKRAALKDHVFIAGNYKIMVGLVLKLEPAQWSTNEDVNLIVESIDNWGESYPTKHFGVRFKSELIARLCEIGCIGSPNDIEWILTHGSFEEFRNMFPENICNRMASSAPSISGSHWLMWVKDNEVQHLAHEGFETGRVDYKLYYGSRDSYDVWTRVIDAGNYHQYLECLDCVRQLTNHPLWVDGFRSGKLDGAVMLGAGSGDKDIELVKSMVALIDQKRSAKYTLIDYSHYMLEATRRQLSGFIALHFPPNVIELKTVLQDFLAFEEADEIIRPSRENVVWVIPGGTFGNLVDEDRFFTSLRTQVRPGDLVVIGVDTAKVDIEKKYSMEELRRFVEPAIREAWHALKLRGTIGSFLKKHIRTVPVDGVRSGHSKVPETVTVEISVKLKGKKTVLLTSCRYKPTALVRFVTSINYVHRGTIESGSNKEFKHFIFEAS